MKAATERRIQRRKDIARVRDALPARGRTVSEIARELGVNRYTVQDAMLVNPSVELVGEPRLVRGVEVFRIRALIDLPIHGVKVGDVGGWAQKPSNLDESGWLSDEAVALGDSLACGSARASGWAVISGRAVMSGNSQASGHSSISGDAVLEGGSRVLDFAVVTGFARVFDSAVVMDSSSVRDRAEACGLSLVMEYARLTGRARAGGSCVLAGSSLAGSSISDESCEVAARAHLFGSAVVPPGVRVGGNYSCGEGKAVSSWRGKPDGRTDYELARRRRDFGGPWPAA